MELWTSGELPPRFKITLFDLLSLTPSLMWTWENSDAGMSVLEFLWMSVWPDSPLSVSTRNTLSHWQLDHGDRWLEWLLWPRPHDWCGYLHTQVGKSYGPDSTISHVFSNCSDGREAWEVFCLSRHLLPRVELHVIFKSGDHETKEGMYWLISLVSGLRLV